MQVHSVPSVLATYWSPDRGPVSLGRKMSTNKDDKSFLIAPLFDGQRGPMFLAWSKKFLDAAEGKGNEDFSYADVFRAW